MDLSKFFKKYLDEQSCIDGFKCKRLEMGLICKKCQHTLHYFRKSDLNLNIKNVASA